MQLKKRLKETIDLLAIMWFKRKGQFIGDSTQFGILIAQKEQKNKALFENYYFDIRKYLTSATLEGIPTEQENLLSRIIAHYHVLEKGLSMPEPRLGFGRDLAKSMISHINKYIESKYETSNQQFQVSLDVLNKYSLFNQNEDNFRNICNEINHLYSTYKSSKIEGGVKTITREELFAYVNADFKKFALSRISSRCFTSKPVSKLIINEVFSIAAKSPSVCNRQAWSTITVLSPKVIQAILEIQNGNRGFGHLIPCLIVVKIDQRAFYGPEERNQGFIDAGIFGMSLVYALHYKQLGSVVLNWATNFEQNKKIKDILQLGESETVVMLIGAGHPTQTLTSPVSVRKQATEINRFVDEREEA